MGLNPAARRIRPLRRVDRQSRRLSRSIKRSARGYSSSSRPVSSQRTRHGQALRCGSPRTRAMRPKLSAWPWCRRRIAITSPGLSSGWIGETVVTSNLLRTRARGAIGPAAVGRLSCRRGASRGGSRKETTLRQTRPAPPARLRRSPRRAPRPAGPWCRGRDFAGSEGPRRPSEAAGSRCSSDSPVSPSPVTSLVADGGLRHRRGAPFRRRAGPHALSPTRLFGCAAARGGAHVRLENTGDVDAHACRSDELPVRLDRGAGDERRYEGDADAGEGFAAVRGPAARPIPRTGCSVPAAGIPRSENHCEGDRDEMEPAVAEIVASRRDGVAKIGEAVIVLDLESGGGRAWVDGRPQMRPTAHGTGSSAGRCSRYNAGGYAGPISTARPEPPRFSGEPGRRMVRAEPGNGPGRR